MKKEIYYQITKYMSYNSYTFRGNGQIVDNDLILADGTKLENAVSYCHLIPNTDNQYKGDYYEIKEIEVETKNGSYETIEVNTSYKIWFKTK